MRKVAAIAIVSLISLAAQAGITGSDPRPPKTGNGIIVQLGPGGGMPSPIGQKGGR